MTSGALEFAIVVGFAAASAIVFVAAGIVAAGAFSRAQHLSRRAKTIVPPGMIAHAQVARAEAQRAVQTLQALQPLAKRASAAASTIAQSLATLRAQIARMRDLTA